MYYIEAEQDRIEAFDAWIESVEKSRADKNWIDMYTLRKMIKEVWRKYRRERIELTKEET